MIITGPCVIESEEHATKMAKKIKEIGLKHQLPIVFKASFDKANRTSYSSYRGPGMEKGLRILNSIKKKTGLPILTDVHEVWQVKKVSEIADIVQIPAFLCRQTDLLIESGRYAKTVNIKKGQFMAPQDMKHAVEKVRFGGNPEIFLTERGTSFGYNNLIVDMRSLIIMRKFSKVIFDATHSVQLPSSIGNKSGGQSRFVFPLIKAALAVGVDAIFMEVHDNPKESLSDGPNMVNLEEFDEILEYMRCYYG